MQCQTKRLLLRKYLILLKSALSDNYLEVSRLFRNLSWGKVDGLVKSPKTVMPDLIRHPEHIEMTGFPLPRE